MSYTSFTYHLVFGTYRRQNVIVPEHERELYKYIYSFSTERGVMIRRIGGMPDHIHILCDIPAKLSVAEYVKLLKAESSKFMRVNSHFPLWDRWAEGYGGFTVDASLREARKLYIMNQKQHHARVSFRSELLTLLEEAGIETDSLDW